MNPTVKPQAPIAQDTETSMTLSDLHMAICPYYRRDRGKGRVYCECSHFKFPDKIVRREIVYRFCAHPTGYKACMLKQAMDGYYDRKEEGREEPY